MKHSTLADCSTNAAICNPTRSRTFKALFVLMIFTAFIRFDGFAQSTLNDVARPACNLSGTLQVRAMNGLRGLPTEVVVLAEVGSTEANSQLEYSFVNNTSGATVKTYGPVSYDPATKKTTQRIVLTPGNPGKGFNVQLKVTNPDGGVCNCSKSVSVIN